MNVSKNEMVISDEEYLALITVAKYQFYKEYVEDLEKAYDDLSLENASLQESYLSKENARLREQNKILVSKNKNLLSTIQKLRGF